MCPLLYYFGLLNVVVRFQDEVNSSYPPGISLDRDYFKTLPKEDISESCLVGNTGHSLSSNHPGSAVEKDPSYSNGSLLNRTGFSLPSRTLSGAVSVTEMYKSTLSRTSTMITTADNFRMRGTIEKTTGKRYGQSAVINEQSSLPKSEVQSSWKPVTDRTWENLTSLLYLISSLVVLSLAILRGWITLSRKRNKFMLCVESSTDPLFFSSKIFTKSLQTLLILSALFDFGHSSLVSSNAVAISTTANETRLRTSWTRSPSSLSNVSHPSSDSLTTVPSSSSYMNSVSSTLLHLPSQGSQHTPLSSAFFKSSSQNLELRALSSSSAVRSSPLLSSSKVLPSFMAPPTALSSSSLLTSPSSIPTFPSSSQSVSKNAIPSSPSPIPSQSFLSSPSPLLSSSSRSKLLSLSILPFSSPLLLASYSSPLTSLLTYLPLPSSSRLPLLAKSTSHSPVLSSSVLSSPPLNSPTSAASLSPLQLQSPSQSKSFFSPSLTLPVPSPSQSMSPLPSATSSPSSSLPSSPSPSPLSAPSSSQSLSPSLSSSPTPFSSLSPRPLTLPASSVLSSLSPTPPPPPLQSPSSTASPFLSPLPTPQPSSSQSPYSTPSTSSRSVTGLSPNSSIPLPPIHTASVPMRSPVPLTLTSVSSTLSGNVLQEQGSTLSSNFQLTFANSTSRTANQTTVPTASTVMSSVSSLVVITLTSISSTTPHGSLQGQASTVSSASRLETANLTLRSANQTIVPTLSSVMGSVSSSVLVTEVPTQTSSSKETRIINVTVSLLNEEFDKDILNESSARFVNLSQRVNYTLWEMFSPNVEGLKEIKILGFRQGSVLVDFQLLTDSTSNVTTQAVNQTLLNNNGTNSQRFIFGLISVKEICSAGYCLNSGTCQEGDSDPVCRCTTGFVGSRCTQRVDVADGNYTEWSEFTECSKTCGGGQKRRSRTCTNPSPKQGGKDCAGLGRDVEYVDCNGDVRCPVSAEVWIAVGVACGVFLLILIFVVLLLLRRRRKQAEQRNGTSGSKEYETNKHSTVIPLEVIYEDKTIPRATPKGHTNPEFIGDDDDDNDIYKAQLLLFLKHSDLIRRNLHPDEQDNKSDTSDHSKSNSRKPSAISASSGKVQEDEDEPPADSGSNQVSNSDDQIFVSQSGRIPPTTDL